MFFYASKLLWFVAAPTNALVLATCLGAILLFTRFMKAGRWIVAVAALGLLAAGFSPLPYLLIRPLEDRFPRQAVTGDIAGIIVLGGAIGTSRGQPSMNDAASRMTDSAALALRFPNARLAFTGGDGSLRPSEEGEADSEAAAARAFYLSLGIPASQLILEDRSRNTRENAVLLKPLLDQKPGQRWLLITSAWHMPRSVGVFRKAGIEIVPYPVDFSTTGTSADLVRFNRGFSYALGLTDLAVKEWIGLIAYRLAGYTDELLPCPAPSSPSPSPRS